MPAYWDSTLTSRESPATLVTLITAADADLATPVKALRIANKGATWLNVTLTSYEGESIVLAVPPGLTIEPVAVKRVSATGTDVGANLVIHGYVR